MNPDNLFQKWQPSNFLIVLLIATLSLFGCSDDSSSNTTADKTAEEIREEVVAETGIDLIPLDFFDWDLQLSDLAGQVVVIHFWASWCGPCIESFPALLQGAQDYPEHQVRFISVNLDDYQSEEAYISALDFLMYSDSRIENYHMLQDQFEVYQFFGLENIPTTHVYTRAGSAQARLGNEGDLFEPALRQAIDQALAIPLEE